MASTAVSAPPTTTTAATLSSTDKRRIIESLVVRAGAFIAVLVALIIYATDFDTLNSLYAYRYMFSTAVIGIAYTIVQLGFTIYHLNTGIQYGGAWMTMVDFYGDKALAYLLATGAAAGLGLTVDVKRSFDHVSLDKAIATACLILLGFIFAAVSSVYSSFHLPKFN